MLDVLHTLTALKNPNTKKHRTGGGGVHASFKSVQMDVSLEASA